MCWEIAKFVDQELSNLKTRIEAIEYELEDILIELIKVINQRDKYKEERDELRKSVEYRKQKALEKNIYKAHMFESIRSHPC